MYSSDGVMFSLVKPAMMEDWSTSVDVGDNSDVCRRRSILTTSVHDFMSRPKSTTEQEAQLSQQGRATVCRWNLEM